MIDYYSRPEMSNSKLTAYKNGGMGPISQRSADLGHLFHTGIFEPHLYQETLDRVRGRITDKDIKMIEAMIASVKKCSSLQIFLKHPKARFETEYFGTLHGVPFKMKADADIPNAFGDGKSTAARTQDQFLESCEKYGYWRQAYIYMTLAGKSKMMFWGVSKSYPHNIFYVDVAQYPKEMAEAEAEVERLCNLWLKEQTGVDELLALLTEYEFSF